MNEFSPQQIGILERLVAKEFVLVAFPLYANAVGVRKGSCAALLDPIANGGFRVFGEPCVLLDGNLNRAHHGKRENLVRMEEAAPGGTAERVGIAKFVRIGKLLVEPQL